MMSRRMGAWAHGRMVLPCSLALAACTAPTRPRADAPTRDSAGIAIIESPTPLWATGHGWTVADTPTLDLGGGTDPHAAFGSLSNALRLSDGRIVVGEQTPTALRYFSRDGQWLYDVGGAGDGRAELRSIFHLSLGANDTVAVFDLARRQLVLFDPNGAHALTVPIAERLTPRGTNGYLPKGLAPDGRYLLQRDEVAFPFAGAPNTLRDVSTRLYWLSRAGTLTDSSPRLRAGELFGFSLAAANGKGIVVPLARPLGPMLHVVAGADRVWLGDGSSWEIRGIDGKGRLTTILRRAGERPLLTAALRDSFIALYRAHATAPGMGEMRRQFALGMAKAPFPDRLPAYGTLMVGADSTLWAGHVSVLDGTAGDPGLAWTVFDPAGRWLGEVTMPPRFYPTSAGRGWILGIWRDEHDVQHVRLFPLVER